MQAQRQQFVQRGAFGGRGQNAVIVPHHRIVHVAVIGRDVEIAEHHQLRVTLHLLAHPVGHRVQPAQFVIVLLAAHGLAVDHIQIDDAHAAHGGGQHALLLIGKAGYAALHLGDFGFAENGYAVVGFLAVEHHVVAGGLDLGLREFVVFQLGFLQHQHIRIADFEPLQQVRKADIERIDVPAGDFHDHDRVGDRLLFTFQAIGGYNSSSRPRGIRTCSKKPAIPPACAACIG